MVFLCVSMVTVVAQIRPFHGTWYANSEVGIFSGSTRMVAGELGKFAPGGSGILVPYSFKIGYNFNPYLSFETGFGTSPLNMVYIYDNSKAIGSNPIHFISIPLRANWRIYVLNRQIEAYTSIGIQYLHVGSQQSSSNFQGNIITSGHAFIDTLAYQGTVNMLRKTAFIAEVGFGINWAMSKRFTFNVYGRQNIGLMNLAMVGISFRQNQEPAEKAEFISRGAGFNVGLGLKYNFK